MIDLDRPLLTKDGRKARILARDIAGPSPLCVALRLKDSGGESVHLYRMDGAYYHTSTSSQDLVNGPLVEVVFKNFSDEEVCIFVHDSLGDAIDAVGDELQIPIGVLRFTITDDVTTAVSLVYTYNGVKEG